MKRLLVICCIGIFFIPFSFISPHSTYAEVNTTYKKHELRAVWIASVLNIDWPSKTGLPIANQKQEFIRLLDDVKNTGMNAVVVQIKPTADAFTLPITVLGLNTLQVHKEKILDTTRSHL